MPQAVGSEYTEQVGAEVSVKCWGDAGGVYLVFWVREFQSFALWGNFISVTCRALQCEVTVGGA